jgi:hypothetical protein
VRAYAVIELGRPVWGDAQTTTTRYGPSTATSNRPSSVASSGCHVALASSRNATSAGGAPVWIVTTVGSGGVTSGLVVHAGSAAVVESARS